MIALLPILSIIPIAICIPRSTPLSFPPAAPRSFRLRVRGCQVVVVASVGGGRERSGVVGGRVAQVGCAERGGLHRVVAAIIVVAVVHVVG